eukprot:ANDGO_03810.mRNA.1 hypothetical protein
MSLVKICDLRGHGESVWCVAWHPSGSVLASCSGDKSIRLWARSTSSAGSQWACIAVLDDSHSRTIRSVAWSPDGRLLACASFDSTVGIWRRVFHNEDGHEFEMEHATTLEGHEHEVKSVAWSMDGSYLAACSRDKSVSVWERDDADDFECASMLFGHSQDVKHVAWSPVDLVLVSASYDDTVRVWVEEGGHDFAVDQVIQAHASTVWDVAFKPAAHEDDADADADAAAVQYTPTLATCSDDCTVKIWERSSSKLGFGKAQFRCVCTLSGFHDRPVYSVSWSRDGDKLASGGGDDSICVFKRPDGPQSQGNDSGEGWYLDHRQARAHNSDVNCVAWNPKNASLLASCSDDAMISLWRYEPFLTKTTTSDMQERT